VHSRVLDAGSGTGGLSLALVDRVGCEVIGVDLSAEAVAVANERLDARTEAVRARFAVADISQLPDDLGDFDAILSFGSSYGLDPDRTVVHWAASLRPHGTVAMLFTRVFAPPSDRDREVGLQTGFFQPHADWEGALTRAGFTIETTDLTDLDGLYFRAYLTQLRLRETDLCAQMGEQAAAAYIGMFEQFLRHYDRGVLRRTEITAQLQGPR
jgi:SAM-dependent methyltransferase